MNSVFAKASSGNMYIMEQENIRDDICREVKAVPEFITASGGWLLYGESGDVFVQYMEPEQLHQSVREIDGRDADAVIAYDPGDCFLRASCDGRKYALIPLDSLASFLKRFPDDGVFLEQECTDEAWGLC